MSDESTVLADIADQPDWVEIDPPAGDDDEYTLGYYDGEQVRVGGERETADDSREFYSGPYEITLIDDSESRLVFVEQEREYRPTLPSSTLTVSGDTAVLPIPDQVTDANNISDGDTFGVGIEVIDGTLSLILVSNPEAAPRTLRVQQPTSSSPFQLAFALRSAFVTGCNLIGTNDVEWDWESHGTEIRVITDYELPQAQISPGAIRAAKPCPLSLITVGSAADMIFYKAQIPADHDAAQQLRDADWVSTHIAHYCDQPILRVDTTAPNSRTAVTRAARHQRDQLEFSIPVTVGDLLRLRDRSYIRWVWNAADECVYGIPTETHEPAPILRNTDTE